MIKKTIKFIIQAKYFNDQDWCVYIGDLSLDLVNGQSQKIYLYENSYFNNEEDARFILSKITKMRGKEYRIIKTIIIEEVVLNSFVYFPRSK